MRSGLRHTAVAVALLGAFGCREAPPPPPVPLTVLATASLQEFAVEAADAFEATANVAVEVRSGGTHELAAELSSTRSADLFLAAGLDWMDRLEEQGLIVPGSRWEAVGNRMVILAVLVRPRGQAGPPTAGAGVPRLPTESGRRRSAAEERLSPGALGSSRAGWELGGHHS